MNTEWIANDINSFLFYFKYDNGIVVMFKNQSLYFRDTHKYL